MTTKKLPDFDPAWAEAKRRCRLNQEEISMAKALGMSPKSLIKNIPSPTQRWKQPVKAWVRGLYAEKFGRKGEKGAPGARSAGDASCNPTHPGKDGNRSPAARIAPFEDGGEAAQGEGADESAWEEYLRWRAEEAG